MMFDAGLLARGWLSVGVASAADKGRPALHRTVAVEQFYSGVRLVATDSYMLLHCWVPSIEDDLAPEPGFDEAPLTTAVVIDGDGRGKSILSYALKLVAQLDEHDSPIEARLDLGVIAMEDDDAPGFAGMEARWAVIEMPDVERVKLRLFEGEYPNWRGIACGFKPDRTQQIALTADMTSRLGKLGKVAGEHVIGWEFGGQVEAARVRVLESAPFVEGFMMPCRWDLDRNEPRVDEPDTDSEAEPDA